MRVFDNILDTLADGEFHSFSDIKLHTDLNENQVEAVLGFLQEYGLVKCLRELGTLTRLRKVKLTTTMLMFLQRLKQRGDFDELSEAKAAFRRELET
jgi:DNA-binding IclR family transcriptional regulator